MIRSKRSLAALAVATFIQLTWCGAVSAQASPPGLNDLVNAAKKEGSVTWYLSISAEIGRRVSEAFQAKYGINTSFIRLSSSQLLQRYAAEADAGKVVAGLLVLTITADQVAKFVKSGWLESSLDGQIPVLKGEYPAELNRGAARMVSTTPWQLGYNTQRVSKDQLPQDFKDLLNPKWKGKIIIPDPASSESYIAVWYAVLQAYGEGFFGSLRGQNLRFAQSAVPAAQALAAGEGDLAYPTLSVNLAPLKKAGAPIELTLLRGANIGNFAQLVVTRRDKATQPNAARLLANYILSKEGNAVFNADGEIGPYDPRAITGAFQPPSPEALKHKETILKLLSGKG